MENPDNDEVLGTWYRHRASRGNPAIGKKINVSQDRGDLVIYKTQHDLLGWEKTYQMSRRNLLRNFSREPL